MNPVLEILRIQGPSSDDAGDVLARLRLAAQEDTELRDRLLAVLQLPAKQREPLFHTAVHEMRLRGESTATCAAFATPATDGGTAVAMRVLRDE